MIEVRNGQAQPPRVLPLGWSLIEVRSDGFAIRDNARGQVVIVSLEWHEAVSWLHLSTSFATRLPTWEELKKVKDWLLGKDTWAYQVLPAAKDYVNIHRYVLHLYARADGEPALPRFTRGTRML